MRWKVLFGPDVFITTCLIIGLVLGMVVVSVSKCRVDHSHQRLVAILACGMLVCMAAVLISGVATGVKYFLK